MIGKVVLTGKTFGETCEYLEREESLSEVLAVEGVRGHDPRLMAEDFEWQHRLMPEKEKPVFHAVLSFPPGERPDDELLVQLSKEYLERIGMVNTQYAFVKHMNKEHLHVHVLANRVNNDGEPIGKGLIIERSIKAAKELTAEYGLQQHAGKRLDRTHLDALHEPDAKRYQIYSAVREVLPECRNLGELEARLQERGIEVRYRHDPETNERQGISFRLENRSFKGSGVDAEFSLKRLERTVELQVRQVQETEQMRSLSEALESMVKGKPVGWDVQESMRRRQDLKERLEKAAAEKAAVEQAQQLRVRQEEKLAEEVEQRQTHRGGYGYEAGVFRLKILYMENNQLQPANGSPVAGKPVTEGPGSEKLNRSTVGVADQLLITLNDHVLNAEAAVNENTAQLRVMASSVELVRQIPKKTEAVEQQLVAMEQRVEQCVGAFNKLWERVDAFEKSTLSKLTERIEGLEFAMRQVATKPAEWGAAMDGLRLQLQRHAELFEKPQVKTVHHRHYLNWYIWIVLGVLGACAGLATLWRDAQKDASLNATNDVLWRGARQFLDSTFQQRLDSVESHYDANPDQFTQDVKAQEAHSAELTQRLQEANQKQREADQAQEEATQAQQEADELKKQKKKR